MKIHVETQEMQNSQNNLNKKKYGRLPSFKTYYKTV